MSFLIEDCPRCKAKQITFEVLEQLYIRTEYSWRKIYEIFCKCRSCRKSTVFIVGATADVSESERRNFDAEEALIRYKEGLNKFFRVEGYINLKNNATEKPPDYLPSDIENIFKEGAACLAIQCYNAAATMFRLCIDLASKALLLLENNTEEQKPNARQRKELAARLDWLFDNKILSTDLRELASCIREDGNDGAHAGNLGKVEAEDLLDFTTTLLERVYTEPEKINIAKERRKARH